MYCPIPRQYIGLERVRLCPNETKKNNNEIIQSFMKEPQYELLISNDQKYLVSGI